MLHACVERFDVMSRRENILGWDGEVNKAQLNSPYVLGHSLVTVFCVPCSAGQLCLLLSWKNKTI
jgi:hypothetical protein